MYTAPFGRKTVYNKHFELGSPVCKTFFAVIFPAFNHPLGYGSRFTADRVESVLTPGRQQGMPLTSRD